MVADYMLKPLQGKKFIQFRKTIMNLPNDYKDDDDHNKDDKPPSTGQPECVGKVVSSTGTMVRPNKKTKFDHSGTMTKKTQTGPLSVEGTRGGSKKVLKKNSSLQGDVTMGTRAHARG